MIVELVIAGAVSLGVIAVVRGAFYHPPPAS
jgi:hypothetical protein